MSVTRLENWRFGGEEASCPEQLREEDRCARPVTMMLSFCDPTPAGMFPDYGHHHGQQSGSHVPFLYTPRPRVDPASDVFTCLFGDLFVKWYAVCCFVCRFALEAVFTRLFGDMFVILYAMHVVWSASLPGMLFVVWGTIS